MSIILYQFPISHYCEKVRWALNYKSIDHKMVNLLPGLHLKKTQQLAKRTSVPVIDDDKRIVQGSADIISYLDDKYPNHQLTPLDELTKNEALQWENQLDQQLGDHVRRVCYHVLLDHPSVVIPFLTHQGPWYGPMLIKLGFKKLQQKMRHYMKINQQSAETSQQLMAKTIEALNQHYQHQPYLVGQQFSRADLTAAALLAPLCQPEGYGLEWPKKQPEALQRIVDQYKDQLQWVNRLYQQHRQHAG